MKGHLHTGRVADPAVPLVLQVQALLKAQQSSRDGVIKLNTDTFAKYITGKQRSFSLFVFLTATNLRDNPQLGLVEMRKDFGYVGKALKEKVAKGEIAAGSIFLVESDFLDSQEVMLCPVVGIGADHPLLFLSSCTSPLLHNISITERLQLSPVPQ